MSRQWSKVPEMEEIRGRYRNDPHFRCAVESLVRADSPQRVAVILAKLQKYDGGAMEGEWAQTSCEVCGVEAGEPCRPGHPECRLICSCPTCEDH